VRLACESSCFTCTDGEATGCLSCSAGTYLYTSTHQCLAQQPILTWCNSSAFCFGLLLSSLARSEIVFSSLSQVFCLFLVFDSSCCVSSSLFMTDCNVTLPHCRACTNSSTCLWCDLAAGWLLQNNSCTDACGDCFFASLTSGRCEGLCVSFVFLFFCLQT